MIGKHRCIGCNDFKEELL